jgi:hypothetical protein
MARWWNTEQPAVFPAYDSDHLRGYFLQKQRGIIANKKHWERRGWSDFGLG